MATLFSIGISGLQTAQRSISVTSQNITNANVEGYSRQRAELGTQDPVQLGTQFVGAGVKVTGITRQHDQFLDDQVLRYTSSSKMSEVYSKMSSQLDELFADKNINISESLQKFYDSVQAVADNPAYIPTRQVMMTEGQTLVERFRVFDHQMSELNNSLNSSLQNYANELSSLSEAIAQLNHDIALTGASGTSFQPNDLLNQRDLLVRRLSEMANVQTAQQADGSLNVFVGQGQALVLGDKSFKVTTIDNDFDPSVKELAYITSGGTFKITNQITGGLIGGALAFRSEVLSPAQANLGRIAYSIADTMNQQHRQGMNLNGDANNVLFRFDNAGGKAVPAGDNTGDAALAVAVTSPVGIGSVKGYELTFDGSVYSLRNLDDDSVEVSGGFPFNSAGGFDLHLSSGSMNPGDRMFIQTQAPMADILSNRNNTGLATVTATVTDINQTSADEFQMTYNGTDFVLRNMTDNSTLTIPGATTFPFPVPGKGFQINVTGTPDPKDTWLIRPTRLGSQSLSLAIREPSEIAAAAPVRSIASTANLGSAVISAPKVNNVANEFLTQPIQLVVSSEVPPTLDIIDVTTATTVAAGISYDPNGTTISHNGWSVTLKGQLRLNDSFDVVYNVNGVGDNANARAMANLQNTRNLDNGKSSVQESYSAIVSGVGTKTRQANNFNASQVALLGRADSQREEVAGVNLDEEAANLMRFQQAYQASAQVLTAADQMLQTLFNALGR